MPGVLDRCGDERFPWMALEDSKTVIISTVGGGALGDPIRWIVYCKDSQIDPDGIDVCSHGGCAAAGLLGFVTDDSIIRRAQSNIDVFEAAGFAVNYGHLGSDGAVFPRMKAKDWRCRSAQRFVNRTKTFYSYNPFGSLGGHRIDRFWVANVIRGPVPEGTFPLTGPLMDDFTMRVLREVVEDVNPSERPVMAVDSSVDRSVIEMIESYNRQHPFCRTIEFV